MMRERLTTAGEAIGAASITIGFGVAWLPLGLIVGGALLIAGCALAARQ